MRDQVLCSNKFQSRGSQGKRQRLILIIYQQHFQTMMMWQNRIKNLI